MPTKDGDKQTTIGALAADVGQAKAISGDNATVSTAQHNSSHGRASAAHSCTTVTPRRLHFKLL